MSKTNDYIIDLHNLQQQIKELKENNKIQEKLIKEINELLKSCKYNLGIENYRKIVEVKEMIEKYNIGIYF